jgi:hypothetical protein
VGGKCLEDHVETVRSNVCRRAHRRRSLAQLLPERRQSGRHFPEELNGKLDL